LRPLSPYLVQELKQNTYETSDDERNDFELFRLSGAIALLMF
jgi:hypothetical protein